MAQTPQYAAPQTTPTWQRYGVLAGLCLIAAIAYVSRNSISVAEEDIRNELGLKLEESGWVLSTFFWSYALTQIPSGGLVKLWGSRRAFSALAVGWSVTTAMVGLSSGLWTLLAARGAFGAAQAGIFPASADSVWRWLPTSRRAMTTGLLGAFMSIGGAAGAAITGALLEGTKIGPWTVHLNWRWTFALLALPGIVWAAWFYWWFRDEPSQHPSVNDEERRLIADGKPPKRDVSSEPTPWLDVVLSFDMWMICGQQFFRAAGYAFYATWFATYLKETRNVTTGGAGYLTTMPLLAAVAGSTLGGVAVDAIWNATGSRRWSRQFVGVISMLGCAAFILAAYFVADPVQAVLLISAGSFFATLCGSSAYTVTIEKGGDHVATVFGTMNMMGNFGAATLPVVLPKFVTLIKSRGASDVESWNAVLLMFVGIYLIAAACWALLNPNGTLFDRQR